MKRAKFSSPLHQRRINIITEIARQGRMSKDVAREAGLSPSRLSQIMYGHERPYNKNCRPLSPDEKRRIALVLGKSERWLFERSGPKARKRKAQDDHPTHGLLPKVPD